MLKRKQVSPEKRKSKRKGKIEFGYYIDEGGLYYVSTICGVVYEEFSINGVIEIKESPDIEILYLCYIDEDSKSKN